MIAVLLIAVAENPLNPFASQDVVVIKNAGKPNMEMLVKEGNELKQYQSSGQIGEGQGMKAGGGLPHEGWQHGLCARDGGGCPKALTDGDGRQSGDENDSPTPRQRALAAAPPPLDL